MKDIWTDIQRRKKNVRHPAETWNVAEALMQLPTEARREIAEKLTKHTKPKNDPEKARLRARVQELEEELTATQKALKNMAEMQQGLLEQKPKTSDIEQWLDI